MLPDQRHKNGRLDRHAAETIGRRPDQGDHLLGATAERQHQPAVGQQLLDERDRLAKGLGDLGLSPLPSATNFLYVPVEDGRGVGQALLERGLVVRSYPDAIRVSVRDEEDDDAAEVTARQGRPLGAGELPPYDTDAT